MATKSFDANYCMKNSNEKFTRICEKGLDGGGECYMFPVPLEKGAAEFEAQCSSGGEKLGSFLRFSPKKFSESAEKILTETRNEFSFDPPKTARRRKPKT